MLWIRDWVSSKSAEWDWMYRRTEQLVQDFLRDHRDYLRERALMPGMVLNLPAPEQPGPVNVRARINILEENIRAINREVKPATATLIAHANSSDIQEKTESFPQHSQSPLTPTPLAPTPELTETKAPAEETDKTSTSTAISIAQPNLSEQKTELVSPRVMTPFSPELSISKSLEDKIKELSELTNERDEVMALMYKSLGSVHSQVDKKLTDLIVKIDSCNQEIERIREADGITEEKWTALPFSQPQSKELSETEELERIKEKLGELENLESRLKSIIQRAQEEKDLNNEDIREGLKKLEDFQQKFQQRIEVQQHIISSPWFKDFYCTIQRKLNGALRHYEGIYSGKAEHSKDSFEKVMELMGEKIDDATLGIGSLITTGISMLYSHRRDQEISNAVELVPIDTKGKEIAVECIAWQLTRRCAEQIQNLTLGKGVKELAKGACERMDYALRKGKISADKPFDEQMIASVFNSTKKMGWFFTNRHLETLHPSNKGWRDQGAFRRAGKKVKERILSSEKEVVNFYYRDDKTHKSTCSNPKKYGYVWATKDEVEALKLTKQDTPTYPDYFRIDCGDENISAGEFSHKAIEGGDTQPLQKQGQTKQELESKEKQLKQENEALKNRVKELEAQLHDSLNSSRLRTSSTSVNNERDSESNLSLNSLMQSSDSASNNSNASSLSSSPSRRRSSSDEGGGTYNSSSSFFKPSPTITLPSSPIPAIDDTQALGEQLDIVIPNQQQTIGSHCTLGSTS